MRTRKQMLVTCCIILIGLLHGMQRATAQTQQLKTDVEFNAPALQGWSIVGTECRNTAEGPSRCSVRLRQENGVKSSWTIDDVVFVAWAKGGESFALETASFQVYVGKAKGMRLPTFCPANIPPQRFHRMEKLYSPKNLDTAIPKRTASAIPRGWL